MLELVNASSHSLSQVWIVAGDHFLTAGALAAGARLEQRLPRPGQDNQLSTYKFLRRHGVEFQTVVEASSGMSVPRVHTIDPAEMIRKLEAKVRASGKVKILLGAAAKRLVRNEKTGRVEGVVVEQDGKTFTILGSHGVLLASGGFTRNRELVHQFVPHYDNAVFISGEGNERGSAPKVTVTNASSIRPMAIVDSIQPIELGP